MIISMDKKKATELDRLLGMVKQDKEVLAVIIFGSAARDEKVLLSDVDICLVITSQPKSFELTSLSHKRLEYMKDNSLDVRIFQQLPLYIRVRVLKEGRILFVRNENKLYELAFRTAQAFEDFKHIYYGYLKEVALAG
jgi:predicted nucleotidyltransferase